MKRIDKLIYNELIGPWIFGVAIFSALIFATVLLVRITDWVVRGVSPATILQIIGLLLPGIVVKTFAMALLLATLLAFGRLSNDSEVIALRAAGTSLFRIMKPVLMFSLAVAAVAFAINENLVPRAAAKATAMTTDIKRQLSQEKGVKPVSYTVMGSHGAVAQIGARDYDIMDQTLHDMTMSTFDKEGHVQWVLVADEFKYFGPKDWRLIGPATLISRDGVSVLQIDNGAWPEQIEKPDITPQNLLVGFADDLDSFSMGQIKEQIDDLNKNPAADKRQLANLEFGYYNKIALPLAAVIFALLGAPLGIRNHRAGIAAGFALSIVLSFGYMMMANFMAVYAKGGAIPPWLASFAPIIIGAIAASVAIYKKNV